MILLFSARLNPKPPITPRATPAVIGRSDCASSIPSTVRNEFIGSSTIAGEWFTNRKWEAPWNVFLLVLLAAYVAVKGSF